MIGRALELRLGGVQLKDDTMYQIEERHLPPGAGS